MAARACGYSPSRSHLIAEYAEIVDETFNSDHMIDLKKKYTNQWVIDGRELTVDDMTKGYTHRTCSGMFSKVASRKETGQNPDHFIPWVAFHFLPNLESPGKYYFSFEGHKWELKKEIGKAGKSKGKLGSRKTKITKAELKKSLEDFTSHYDGESANGNVENWLIIERMVCCPDSWTSKKMMEDIEAACHAVKKKGALGSKSSLSKLERHLADSEVYQFWIFGKFLEKTDKALRGPFGGCAGFSADKFLTALVGIRMHVYADTWAHQGFAGIRSPALNDVVGLKCWKNANAAGQPLPWKPRLRETRSLSIARELTFFGHGRADTFPDHPAILMKYIRPWDGRELYRWNPDEFSRAYRAMVKWLDVYGQIMGWSRKESCVAAFSPKVINIDFFKDKIKGSNDKPYRCDIFQKFIANNDKAELAKFNKSEFQIIRQLYSRSRVDLAYFTLAANYHQRWVEHQIDSKFGGTGAGNGFDILRRVLPSVTY